MISRAIFIAIARENQVSRAEISVGLATNKSIAIFDESWIFPETVGELH